MGEILKNFFTNVFTNIEIVMSDFRVIIDILDIVLVAVVIYLLITRLRKTQSIQIINGVILISALYFLVNALKMTASLFIFENLFSNLLLIVIIIFNTEIRQSLELIGQSRLKKISLFNASNDEASLREAINAACRACAGMSADSIGSLIIFQRETFLGDLTKNGVDIDCVTTSEMLCGIFFPNSPMHDGAVVISGGRIVAARCIVPLKNDREVVENIGTRHRAALEISRASDAVAVVTSEESGLISIAADGVLTRGVTDGELRELLTGLLISEDGNNKPKTISGRLNKLFSGGKSR